MTIIAWDGSTLTADRQHSSGGVVFPAPKLFRLPNGKVAAFCGVADTGLAIIDWIRNGEVPADFPPGVDGDRVGVIVVDPVKRLLYEYEGRPVPMYREWNLIGAWGSAKGIAIGAMAMGASAPKAVQIACKYSPDCGLGCTSVKIK